MKREDAQIIAALMGPTGIFLFLGFLYFLSGNMKWTGIMWGTAAFCIFGMIWIWWDSRVKIPPDLKDALLRPPNVTKTIDEDGTIIIEIDGMQFEGILKDGSTTEKKEGEAV
jgi:hypothetical protein